MRRWTTVAEAAAWWAALGALYLVLITSVGPLEFALGALAALLGALVTRPTALRRRSVLVTRPTVRQRRRTPAAAR
ncbi:hypothetical protein [Kitasatospora sp. NPDC004531]